MLARSLTMPSDDFTSAGYNNINYQRKSNGSEGSGIRAGWRGERARKSRRRDAQAVADSRPFQRSKQRYFVTTKKNIDWGVREGKRKTETERKRTSEDEMRVGEERSTTSTHRTHSARHSPHLCHLTHVGRAQVVSGGSRYGVQEGPC